MNKKLLSLIVAAIIAGQSVHAADTVWEWVGKIFCDGFRVSAPTWTTGKAIPNLMKVKVKDATGQETEALAFGQKATKEQIEQAKKQIEVSDPNANVKVDKAGIYFIAENGKFKLVDSADNNIPEEQKAPIVESVITAEQDWQNQYNTSNNKFHSQLAKTIHSWKMLLLLEKPYFLFFWATTLYGAAKIAQKLNDTYGEEQKGIDFDEFADEMEAVAKKIESTVKAEAQA